MAFGLPAYKTEHLDFQNKLDGYIKEEESGKELSSEQQKAVEKYDEVIQQLSLSKEFCKQFQVLANTASKEAKRDARKVSESSLLVIQFQLCNHDIITFL